MELVPVFFDLETTGLYPLENRIVSVGYKIAGKERKILMCNNEEEELDAIEKFLCDVFSEDCADPLRRVLLVGYNINFDLSFIACRTAKLVSKHRRFFELKDVLRRSGKLRRLHRVDLMHIVSKYWLNGSRKSMRKVCDELGISFDDVDGKDVPELVEQGERGLNKVKEHLECDLLRVERLFEILNMQGLIVHDILSLRYIEHNMRIKYNFEIVEGGFES